MKKKKTLGMYALKGLFAVVLLIFFDQFTKYLAEVYLAQHPSVPLIPGVLELKYLENTGMAFGLMAGRKLFFVLVCLLFFLLGIYLFIRIPKKRYYLPLFVILLVMESGAAGNFIDRIFRGYVVDFIYVSFIDFPIFNLADIYVVCSSILLVFFVCLKYREEDFAFLNPRHKG